MATGTKFSPRTKHIALKYHHFRSHVKSGRVDIHYRPTGEQLADLLWMSTRPDFTLYLKWWYFRAMCFFLGENFVPVAILIHY